MPAQDAICFVKGRNIESGELSHTFHQASTSTKNLKMPLVINSTGGSNQQKDIHA